MLYLIVEKIDENTNFVVLGPMEWRPNFFRRCLLDEYDVDFSIPSSNDTNEFIKVNDILSIYPVHDVGPISSFNSSIHNLVGPYYNYYDTYAEVYYNVEDKPIEVIKAELKPSVAANRYNYETQGVSVTIQNQTVTALTSREDRNLYLQAYQLGKDNVNWKFGDIFLTLSNSDLGIIVFAVVTHVQNCFDWEAAKYTEIDNCQTVEELNSVLLYSTVYGSAPPTPPNLDLMGAGT